MFKNIKPNGEKMNTSTKRILYDQKMQCYLIMALTGIFMLLLNVCTPIAVDDFIYLYSFMDGERITSFSQIPESMQVHYYTMNGRTVSHVFSTIFLMGPMWIFDVVNSIMYVCFGYLIYRFAIVDKEYDSKLLFSVYVVLFLTIPVVGQTVLWLTGACNYMWGGVTVLCFAFPYRIYLEKDVKMSKCQIILFAILSFLAGGYMENLSGAVMCLVGMFMIYMLYMKKKWKAWMFVGAIFYSIGFIGMIATPAIQKRLSFTGETTTVTISDNFLKLTQITEERSYVILLFIVVMLMIAIHAKSDKKVIVIPCMLVIAGLLCTYVLAFITYYVDRAYFGSQILYVVAAVYLWHHVNIPWLSVAKNILVSYLIMQFAFQGFYATGSIVLSYNWTLDREEIIESYVDAGIYDVETFSILMDKYPYSIYYFYGSDLFDSKDMWINQAKAKYYGLNSIQPNRVRTW